MFGKHKHPSDYEPSLILLTPPRSGEQAWGGIENMVSVMASEEPFCLELSSSDQSTELMVRCADSMARFRRALQAHFPQAHLQQVDAEADPMHLRDNEMAHTQTLRIVGPDFLPIKIFDHRETMEQEGADPLISVLGALSGLAEGERMVSRIVLKSLGHKWAEEHHSKAMAGAGSANQLVANQQADQRRAASAPSPTSESTGPSPTIFYLIVPIALAIFLYYDWTQGNYVRFFGILATMVVGGLAGAYFYFKWKASREVTEEYYDPSVVQPRVSTLGFEAEIQVTLIQQAQGGYARAEALLSNAISAYSHYNNAMGSQLEPGPILEGLPSGAALLQPVPLSNGLFSKKAPSLLSLAEVVSLWHPPQYASAVQSMSRVTSRMLPPPPSGTDEGALVGKAMVGGVERMIHFSDDTLQRHQLFVARTRMGKSTLISHVVEYKLAQKAAGLANDAIIVIDPHTDLVENLLERTPAELADQVFLVHLGDMERVPGINLLDVNVFTDRDRTADGLRRVTQGLWEQWGPRMQLILEHCVKSLHEANQSPLTPPDNQYTLLDARRVLSSSSFRDEMLSRVSDPFLLQWWKEDFGSWDNRSRIEAISPVQNRLGYFSSSKVARRIIGQAKSTIDISSVIRDGGILYVAAAQSYVGRDVASLVSSCILNLVDSLIRQQGELPPSERRPALVVADEMQTLPGVDFEGMLGEVAKYGGSLVLATQGLTKLEELSPTMKDTILSNTGCLCVFQVAASDARQLVWELGKETVTEDDITSLPVHHCYVRATSGNQRLPPYSMGLQPPTEGRPEVAEYIKRKAYSYTLPARDIDRAVNAPVEDDVHSFRIGLAKTANEHVGSGQIREAVDAQEAREEAEDSVVLSNGESAVTPAGRNAARRGRTRSAPTVSAD